MTCARRPPASPDGGQFRARTRQSATSRVVAGRGSWQPAGRIPSRSLGATSWQRGRRWQEENHGHHSHPPGCARHARGARGRGMLGRLWRRVTQRGPGVRAPGERPGVRRGQPERGRRRAGHADVLRGRQQRDPGPVAGAHRRLHREAPGRHDRDRDASGRRRGRQPRQDPARHRRDGRHVLLQLRLAVPGAQPGADAGRPVGRAVRRQRRRLVQAACHGRTARSTASRRGRPWAAASSTTRRSTPISASASPRPGPSSWPTTRRSRPPARRPVCQTFGDTWTSPAVRARGLLQRAGRRSRLRRRLHRQQGASTPTTPAALAGFQHLRKTSFKAGYLNEDFGAAKFETASAMVADRQGRALPDADLRGRQHRAELPGEPQRVGFFAQPGRRRGEERLPRSGCRPRPTSRRPRPSTARRGQGVRRTSSPHRGLRRP